MNQPAATDRVDVIGVFASVLDEGGCRARTMPGEETHADELA